MNRFIIFITILVSIKANASLKEIKCTPSPVNSQQYDLYLKPNEQNKYEFKRCEPTNGMFNCGVFSGSDCASISIKNIASGIEITGTCTWQSTPRLTYAFSFYPVSLDPNTDPNGRHMITIKIGDENPKMYGDNYFCKYN